MWREAEAEAREALEAITELYDQRASALPHYNESQMEEHWIRPVLDILGHVYEVQPPLSGALGTPEYAFFTNANPCYQTDYYLRRTGCAWGVVSNGRRWRLYMG